MATATATTTTTTTVTVPGESPVRTNIPIARDRRASGGRYLALLTTEEPPSAHGWFATYRLKAPHAGVYALTAVATAPLETPHTEAVASYLQLGINNGPFVDLARSQPHWYDDSKPAWGDLSILDLGRVELRRGDNTLTVRVHAEPAVLDTTTAYALSLDHLTLRLLHRHPALHQLTVPRHRDGEIARLHLTLDGHATRPYAVHYTVTDYDGHRVADGDAAIPVGRTTVTVALPHGLPPGHYRVHADNVTGAFARLPARPAPTGTVSRFGVNIWHSSLIPPSRLPEFAAAVRDMGAGWVRDGQSWPVAEPAPGTYDTAHHDRAIRTLRAHDLAVLDALSPAPEWAMTDASLPLPADLRHAYRYARRLAQAGPEALQLSNEPDVDTTRSTGDAHAAFVKAAALGVKDASDAPPLVVLPGIAQAGPFQDLMLANDVVRYADVWAFHGYPDPTAPGEPEFPGAADEQHALARRHGADVPLWMTECGAFQMTPRDLTSAQEVVQARYLVKSMVEGLAAGNAKQFWFAGPPLHDDGVYFGLLDREFAPLPAYSAFAALTSLLGAARFVTARQLADGVRAFVFDSGRGELVTVAWSTKRGLRRLDLPGVAYDIMGRRISGTVTASPDPVYVVSRAHFEPCGAPQGRRRLPSPAEHIVLSQRYSARNGAPGKDNGDAPPPYGYRLGRRTRMVVDVYNFGAAARWVTVTGRGDGGWSVRAGSGSGRVRVPGRGRVAVRFTLVAGSSVRRRVDHRVTFRARLDDQADIPVSVALVHVK